MNRLVKERGKKDLFRLSFFVSESVHDGGSCNDCRICVNSYYSYLLLWLLSWDRPFLVHWCWFSPGKPLEDGYAYGFSLTQIANLRLLLLLWGVSLHVTRDFLCIR